MKRSGFVLILLLLCCVQSFAQGTGRVAGRVQDATGGLIVGAHVTLRMKAGDGAQQDSNGSGTYAFNGLQRGSYDLRVEAQGFARFSVSGIAVEDGKTRQINVTLHIETEEQVTVTTQTTGVSLNADENANATVLHSSDLEAMADDPEVFQSQLQALAGPSAGPDGGQLYIDGYTGGQLPPKSSILEVRINQNPFSAENDRIGYGRIDIITKPGAVKFAGHVRASYLNSALDTSNSLASVQPSYQYYSVSADVTGPITKTSSYLVAGQYWQRQNESFLRAVDPSDTSSNPRVLSLALPAPYSTANAIARVDAQAGKHLVSAQYVLFRTRKTGAGTGGLNLQEQAYGSMDTEQSLQVRDTMLLSARFINEVGARWMHIRTSQSPVSMRPMVTVQGAFVSGGSYQGAVRNHQDNLELHDYATLTAGTHAMRIGALARSYRVVDDAASGTNGNYIFASVADFHAAAPRPYLYTATVVTQPVAKLLQFDGALFFQDEWRWKPNLNVSYGLRVEGQNRVHDPVNWAPRASLAWSPFMKANTPAKTVFRAAGGVFYNRFGLSSQIQTIHNNGFFQQSYVLRNPTFYDPNTPVPVAFLTSSNQSKDFVNTLDPHFRIARNVQFALGVDHSFGKIGSLNVNYLYTRGVHQYLTNNVNAPTFDVSTYTFTSAAPATYNYQFQAGGDFRQHQFIVTTNTSYRKVTLHAVYTLNHARTDTQGVNYFPSVAQNPALDMGRASFASTHQVEAYGTYAAPWKINLSMFAVAQSGRPYNITIGNDLTGNNQSNARPTYGTCGAADVVTTQYGCLDTNPAGKGERIVHYNIGTGPANAVVYLTAMRVFGFGQRVTTGPKQTAKQPRFTLTTIVGATNLFNQVNLAAPNGVLKSPLFGQQLAPAAVPFQLSSPGNRTVYFTSYFSF